MALSRARLALALALFTVIALILSPHETITRTYRSYYGSAHDLVMPGESTNASKMNAVIVMLLGPSRLHQATIALLEMENRFNRRLQYPYVLFTASEEENAMISEEARQKIEYITQGRAKFVTLTKEFWGVPDFYDESRVEESIRTIGFTVDYRSMCRFYSGLFWKHPELAKYDWLWRLDTDIEFHCDIPYDPIQRMADVNALYGFVQISPDGTWIQPSLASNVSQFLSSYYSTHPSSLPAEVNHGFAWDGKDGIEKALRGEAGSDEWTKMCMYNNFEISHRSLWESEIYTSFFEYLDQAGGLFYERWGDAPIHSFGVAMALRRDQVMQFRDTGYQHKGWAYECPPLDRCTCLMEGAAVDFDDRGRLWFDAPSI